MRPCSRPSAGFWFILQSEDLSFFPYLSPPQDKFSRPGILTATENGIQRSFALLLLHGLSANPPSGWQLLPLKSPAVDLFQKRLFHEKKAAFHLLRSQFYKKFLCGFSEEFNRLYKGIFNGIRAYLLFCQKMGVILLH